MFNSIFSQTASLLKFVIYDFDGLDIGATNLPDGDFQIGDLSYEITANPLPASDVLGDRVLKANLNWINGTGEFGKGMDKFFQLSVLQDRINFYFYSPLSNAANVQVRVIITEDDDNDNFYQSSADDSWIDTVQLSSSAGWQLVSLPLSDFKDRNTGGNGIFDVGFGANEGKLFVVRIAFDQTSTTVTSETYYLDMISFSQGNLPSGNTILDLPPGDGVNCELGAFTGTSPDSAPAVIENKFTNGKKIKYVNWFMQYSATGTVPVNFPGAEVQNLLNNGYRPVLTWEMMYAQYSRLDPLQPRLDKILNGTFDAYIDSFADKIKSYNDTIILRIFHEFDGFWYSWSITENNQDTTTFINAYRYVVDRFNMRGATKVLWMWCVNSDSEPYLAYNWIVNAYPGDNYVDIVATDIYNHPNLPVPDWKSFRYLLSESYYTLTKYFPNKPFYLCELACRERYVSEDVSSQTKADWICQMSGDLKTYFSKIDAIIFFDTPKEHDWRVNSSVAALNAVNNCIWTDNYFGETTGVNENFASASLNVFPNPFESELTITFKKANSIQVVNILGTEVYREKINESATNKTLDLSALSNGIY
ncbi:MAG: T9SS type A sorting domain-containing protein, partial [Bacteroidia bacterium]|nr:T9SS type A sorting domain-containing protein [Bacteroidia bacterium]